MKKKNGPRKRTRPKGRQHFVLNVGPYKKNLFICTGFESGAEVIRAQPAGSKEWWLDWLKENERDIDDLLSRSSEASAFCMVHPRYGSGVLALPTFTKEWEFWETLIHELSHYVQYVCENINAEGEHELRAYLHEHLFSEIRRRLLDK